MHDLRRETASLMGAAEEDPHVIQQVLGRSRAGTTIDTHWHVFRKISRAAVNASAAGTDHVDRKVDEVSPSWTRFAHPTSELRRSLPALDESDLTWPSPTYVDPVLWHVRGPGSPHRGEDRIGGARRFGSGQCVGDGAVDVGGEGVAGMPEQVLHGVQAGRAVQRVHRVPCCRS
jgi:hypothetical protein